MEQPPQTIRTFDGQEIGKDFINFFYTSWVQNPDQLIEVIKEYSKLKYNNNIYEGINFINLIKSFSINKLNFTNIKYEVLDSRSRQIFILVTGTISYHTCSLPFQQSFMVAYAGEKKDRKWSLMNSLLII